MNRVIEIVNILLDSKMPITVDGMADRLKISNKTIRNELPKVEQYVNKAGLRLTKKPGSGVSIDGAEDEKGRLSQDIQALAGFIEPFSPEDRKNFILKRLLMSDGRITIKELADELYVSRVTVHKDLDEVENWLGKYNLNLLAKTNYGIEIKGEEENWRNAVASLIAANKQQHELKELLYEEYSGRIDYKTLVKLKELINLDYRQLEKIVITAEAKLKFRFSDEAYISFVIHIAIAIKRLESNKDISFAENVLQNLTEKEEYPVALQLARDIEQSFKVKFSPSEIVYILLHILGAKMQHSKMSDVSLDLEMQEQDLAVIMTREIIKLAQNALTIDLSGDKQLTNGLILHLRPTINRLKYGLTLRNPILHEIKENYPQIYGVAWMTSVVFERYLDARVNEEEIGYIALHLGAAVERARKPIRALVVCTSGIGTSQMLAARLNRCFREIEIKDVISAIALKGRPLDDIDIIISTVPVEANKPVLNINPLLTQNDIKKISKFISDMENRTGQKAQITFYIELIPMSAPDLNKVAVLREMCAKLQKKGYIKKKFIASVLERESIAPTALGNGTAIPHGSPQLAMKPALALTMLKEPVAWGKEQVADAIFMIILPSDHLKEGQIIFRNLYDALDSEDFLNFLRNAKDGKKISEKLGELINVNQ